MSTPSSTRQRCLIIGDPVAHSLSPRMHNAGYKALGIENEFVFEHCQVTSEELPEFIARMRQDSSIRGAACTMPHKETLLALVDTVDARATRIGAINTLLCNNGKIEGHNTDWIGILAPLRQHIDLIGKKALILGAGGAARAAIVGLLEGGASVTVTNRSTGKAELLADQFSITALDWTQRGDSGSWDIIINTSALGMHPYENESPLPGYPFSPEQIVFETVYFPRITTLLQQASSARTLRGIDMLLHQGVAQFELFTGRQAPFAAMQQALDE